MKHQRRSSWVAFFYALADFNDWSAWFLNVELAYSGTHPNSPAKAASPSPLAGDRIPANEPPPLGRPD